MALISDLTWTRLRQLRTDGLKELQEKFSPTTFVVWTKDRPKDGSDTWDNGKKPEGWRIRASGSGILRPNGQGGPVIGEGAIWQQAPYELRTSVAIFDELRAPKEDKSEFSPANAWMVVDGSRLLKIEHVSIADIEKPIATAYLTEMFGATLPPDPPGVTP